MWEHFRSHPVFGDLSVADLQAIESFGSVRQVPAGEVLFRIGEPGDALYLVLEGRLEFQLSSDLPVREVGAGELIGELALFARHGRRSGTATTLTDSRVFELSRAAFDELVASRPQVAIAMLRTTLDYLLDAERDLLDGLEDKAAQLRSARSRLAMQKRLSRTDGLTGLYNRRGFELVISRLTDDSIEPDQGLALLYVDLDFLKDINDCHGHDAGDRALKAVAETLRRSVRSSDFSCRIGGDEFAVVMPGISPAQARRKAEQIREAVCAAKIVAREGQAAFSVSVSVGGALGDRQVSSGALRRAADRSLYEAKSRGRNRVHWHSG